MCISLAEQSLEVQLQTSDGGVKGIQLSAFLSCSAQSIGARRPKVGLKVSVEVVATLHFIQAAIQSDLKGFNHCEDGLMQQWGWSSRGLPPVYLLNSPGGQEESQSTKTFRTLSNPQLEKHL